MKNVIFSIIILISFANNADSQVYATFVGDTVKIWDASIEWSCSGSFFPIVTMSQDTIYITECDTMRLVTCMCYFTVSTSLSGLNAGIYTAMVTRQHREHIQFPHDTIYVSNTFAGSVAFTVLSPPSISPKSSLHQSPCRSTPGFVFDDIVVANQFAMLTNYPNPFNPNTTFQYTIPNRTQVSLKIYNLTGQVISTLIEGNQQAGTYEINYSPQNISSGVYLCRLNFGDRSLSTKVLLIK